MDIQQILVFVAFAGIYLLFLPAQWRGWALLIASVLAMYWLQPTLNIRWLDYSLPTATLLISVVGWYWTQPHGEKPTREDAITLGIVLGIPLLLALTRYVDVPDFLLLTSRPPELVGVVLGIVLLLAFATSTQRFLVNRKLVMGMLLIIGIFVLIKTELFAVAMAGFLRGQAGQDASIASVIDLNWLGFSYVAFRLIHTLRDRQTGVLPSLRLKEYLTYIIFFPAYVAGPIDRSERFSQDFNALLALKGLDSNRITVALTRIAVGMFKKFVIADSLALFALSSLNAEQALHSGALWLMLYAYAFRLFFDFSGYTDIAIGIGLLFGIKLPENFNHPYLKTTITAFWQSWHMSLSNWVRFYVFSPLSRHLLRLERKPSNELIMFLCHMSTMLIIGLWHGVSVPFFIWGAWHGFALWAHKLWSDRTRKWYGGLKNTPRAKTAWTAFTWFVTFHYVVLGWVWFALPSFDEALRVMLGLFGVMP